jgi:hypothetical protein
VRLARTVALAQQQDPLSLQAVADALPTLDDYLKIPASLALAQARAARGSALLNGLMTSPVDLQRILAAEAVTHLNRSAAAPAILESLANGSPAIKPAALRVAGMAGLGTDRAVYSALGGADPIARAQAVEAIATTLASPVVTSPVALPPPPTPLQP